MLEMTFLLFGLGFFLFVVLIINRDNREQYERRLNEKREFGVWPEDRNREPR